ncbi:hypothetical protein BJI48_06345 [Helicobacter sp. 11S02596-1]|nr:hypothetical protein BJI48_06345 [Helicobacter sp. 11S02596-1]
MPFLNAIFRHFPAFFGAVLLPIFLVSCASMSDFFTNKPPKEVLEKQAREAQEAKAKQPPPEFKLITIKTPMFRFYDYGILHTRPDAIELELFKLGRSIGSIRIEKSKICFLNDCYRKWPAAKNFFGKVSYGDLFEDILLGKDIFGGIGKVIGPDNTLIQRFQKSGEIIFYERKPGHTLFRNMSTGVVIAIDDYQEDTP